MAPFLPPSHLGPASLDRGTGKGPHGLFKGQHSSEPRPSIRGTPVFGSGLVFPKSNQPFEILVVNRICRPRSTLRQDTRPEDNPLMQTNHRLATIIYIPPPSVN
ncbi:hypothetical protein FALCPG4_017660 [Fusarium falciforme]